MFFCLKRTWIISSAREIKFNLFRRSSLLSNSSVFRPKQGHTDYQDLTSDLNVRDEESIIRDSDTLFGIQSSWTHHSGFGVHHFGSVTYHSRDSQSFIRDSESIVQDPENTPLGIQGCGINHSGFRTTRSYSRMHRQESEAFLYCFALHEHNGDTKIRKLYFELMFLLL